MGQAIPAVIVMLGVLVVVHEFGHFLIGTLSGIAVETFSIGFGPTILKWTRKETTYRIGLLPLGGFVKFYGSTPADPVPQELVGKEFFRASCSRRAATVLAGPVANFLLAATIYFVLSIPGIPFLQPLVGYINPGSPAEAAGLLAGDRILAINGKNISTWKEMESFISASPGVQLSLEVERKGETVKIVATPKSEPSPFGGNFDRIGRLGISAAQATSLLGVRGDSKAVPLGFKNADRIIAASWTAGERTPINRSISSFTELEDAIIDAWSDGAAQILWQVENALAEKEPKRTIEVALPEREGNDADWGAMRSMATRMLNRIGLQDGQLLIDQLGASSGLLRGDMLLEISGKPVVNQFDVYRAMEEITTPTGKVKISRNGETLELPMAFQQTDRETADGPKVHFELPFEFFAALKPPEPFMKETTFLDSIVFGVTETASQSWMLVKVVASLFTGKVSVATMGGPILIAKVAGDAAKRGLETFLGTLAIISINLAIVNLVPVPVLDGGQLALIGAEAVRRRPLRISTIENYQRLGFVMIMALIVLVFYNDLNRFWAKMFLGMTGGVPQ